MGLSIDLKDIKSGLKVHFADYYKDVFAVAFPNYKAPETAESGVAKPTKKATSTKLSTKKTAQKKVAKTKATTKKIVPKTKKVKLVAKTRKSKA